MNAASLGYVSGLDSILKAKKRWGVSAMALCYRLHKLGLISDWQYRMFCIQLNKLAGTAEPDGMLPERSSVWQMVLTELWKDGISRSHVATQLHLPQDEIENLLFGLAGDTARPPRSSGRDALRAVT